MQWNLIPHVFYDMIGRFCPGLIVLITGLVVVVGPRKIWLGILSAASDKTNALPILPVYIYVVLALAAYFFADMLHQVWRTFFSKKQSISSCLDDWKKRKKLLNENGMELIDADLPKDYVMLDYLRIRIPVEAHRLLKIKAEQRSSAVIVIGYSLLSIINFLLLFDSDRFIVDGWIFEIFLVLCAVLSHLRERNSAKHLKIGTVTAWLTCAYEPDMTAGSVDQLDKK